MRVKKAGVNAVVTLITFILGTIPAFIVRKIFLNELGSEMLGLTSLYANIIGILAIAELGIGSAIVFSLYKPFAERDYCKVKGYLDYYKKMYRNIGIIILITGFIITPFLSIFIKDEINIIEASIYFILYLFNTFISYLFTYKLCLLNVAQENYKVSISTTLSKLIIAMAQVFLLKFYQNIYGYILVQILINMIYYIFINMYINKRYSFILKVSGYIDKVEKKNLVKNIKALFLHKIAGVVVLSTDNLIISSFIDLVTVTKFNSYNTIIVAVQGVISSIFASITASVGSLLTERDRKKSYKVHKRLFFINFWIVSTVVILLYNFITKFVIVWLGEEQVINNFTVILIMINLYFLLMRLSIDIFKDSGGLYYQDRLAPVIEAIINLVSSIILVKIIGLPGVFLGTLISNFSVIFWIKPIIVYKYIFKKSPIAYFIQYFKYVLIGIVPLIITNYISINGSLSIYSIFIEASIHFVIINIVYIIIFRNNDEFKYFISLLKNIISKIIVRFNIS